MKKIIFVAVLIISTSASAYDYRISGKDDVQYIYRGGQGYSMPEVQKRNDDFYRELRQNNQRQSDYLLYGNKRNRDRYLGIDRGSYDWDR